MKISNPNLTTPDWLIVGMNRAMLGMIHADIRLITAEFDELKQKLIIRCYLDREVTDDDREDMEIMITELSAGYGSYDCDCECIYSLLSTRELNHTYGAVFRRKE
ncbi:hypothetical protein [Kingella potus]|uniref:hypothetical protein n=1 Tax=Kingella potus TaxID=265175 RepID=UPI000E1C3460|nr:hypothetical protein [Kingella potus]UOP00334.1 hypothetical protein LVJ84_10570 [Kingella potus]